MPEPIVAGNWKMHGSRALIDDWFEGLAASGPRPQGVRMVLFPPAVFLGYCRERAAALGIELGGQTVHPQAEGPHTGELAAEMLADAGAHWSLVGHSERRRDRGETDADVAAQVLATLRAGLTPMICVGETLAEREADNAQSSVRRQLRAVIETVGAAGLRSVAIAYEPVWAIGTGVTASAEQAQEMHRAIRDVLASTSPSLAHLSVVYGGSVKPDNAAGLFAQRDVDGGLVGGASLDAGDMMVLTSAAVE